MYFCERGNKTTITEEEGNMLKKSIQARQYIECSALNKENVETVFLESLKVGLGNSQKPKSPCSIIWKIIIYTGKYLLHDSVFCSLPPSVRPVSKSLEFQKFSSKTKQKLVVFTNTCFWRVS